MKAIAAIEKSAPLAEAACGHPLNIKMTFTPDKNMMS
jgi:hypothetical protein